MLLKDHLCLETIDADFIVSYSKEKLDLPQGTSYRVSVRVVDRQTSVILLEGGTEACADAIVNKIENHKNKKDLIK